MAKTTQKLAKDVRLIIPANKPKAGSGRKSYVSSVQIVKGAGKAPKNVTKH